jgi:hypothetical protein
MRSPFSNPQGDGIHGISSCSRKRSGGKQGKSKNWIKGAIKKPGTLKAAAKRDKAIDKDGNIKVSWLKKTAKRKDKMGQRARLALTLKKLK